jgi:hemerythrin-like metal-binding protein
MISVFKVSIPETSKKNGADPAAKTVDLVPWTNKLSIGIPEIDDQHKKLVALVNQLHRAMTLKQGASQAGHILDELVDYTTTHFSFEEKLFNEHGYPEKDAHIETHRKLVTKVQEFQHEFKNGKAGLSLELMDFLADWLKSHIMKTDRAYTPFFEGISIKK